MFQEKYLIFREKGGSETADLGDDDFKLDLSGLDAALSRKSQDAGPKDSADQKNQEKNELIDTRNELVDVHGEITNASTELINAINSHITHTELSEIHAKEIRHNYNSFMQQCADLARINGKAAIIDIKRQDVDVANEHTIWTIDFNKKPWNSLPKGELQEHIRVAKTILGSIKEETSRWTDTSKVSQIEANLGNGG